MNGGEPLFSFEPLTVPELRNRFLAHHEDVLRSSVGTIRRYRAATQHLVDFAAISGAALPAHQLSPSRFATFLRERVVSPNGHPHTARRPLRDKGVRYILEVARSLYGYAQRMRHLPPYARNPFSDLRLDRIRVDDAKPIYVFDAGRELTFLSAATDREFPVQFALAKTGLRPGELVHLLVEDLDLDGGWLHIRNKPDLGWRIKTGRERSLPLLPEMAEVLRGVVGARPVGPVFLRPRFQNGDLPSLVLDRTGLAKVFVQRIAEDRLTTGSEPSRERRLRIARTVWRDAGALKVDAVRRSFLRIAGSLGWSEATCPKSWRHSFATLLQDARVDPLVRQIVLGHQPVGGTGALGMTGVYTHTRPETLREEVLRALRLWPRSLDLTRRRSRS